MYYTASGIVYDTTGFVGFKVSSTLELRIVLQLGTFHLPPETGGDSAGAKSGPRTTWYSRPAPQVSEPWSLARPKAPVAAGMKSLPRILAHGGHGAVRKVIANSNPRQTLHSDPY